MCAMSPHSSLSRRQNNPSVRPIARESMLHFDFYGSFTIYCVIYELFTRPSQSIMKIVLVWKPSLTIASCVFVT